MIGLNSFANQHSTSIEREPTPGDMLELSKLLEEDLDQFLLRESTDEGDYFSPRPFGTSTQGYAFPQPTPLREMTEMSQIPTTRNTVSPQSSEENLDLPPWYKIENFNRQPYGNSQLLDFPCTIPMISFDLSSQLFGDFSAGLSANLVSRLASEGREVSFSNSLPALFKIPFTLTNEQFVSDDSTNAAMEVTPNASQPSRAKVVHVQGKASNKKKSLLKTKKPPLHALSAYNYFFRDERDRIINGMDYEWTKTKQDKLLREHWTRDRSKKRIHCKTHGKINFTTLSKLVSARWKELPEENKNFYKEIASRDWARYLCELAEYRATVA